MERLNNLVPLEHIVKKQQATIEELLKKNQAKDIEIKSLKRRKPIKGNIQSILKFREEEIKELKEKILKLETQIKCQEK